MTNQINFYFLKHLNRFKIGCILGYILIGFTLSSSAKQVGVVTGAPILKPTALKSPAYFMSGKYRLTLILNEHEFSKKGRREFSILIKDERNQMESISEIVDIVEETGNKNKVLTRTYSIELNEQNNINLVLKGSMNEAIINGLILEPVEN